MDLYSSPISIEYAWKIPEQELKDLSDTWKNLCSNAYQIKELQHIGFDIELMVEDLMNDDDVKEPMLKVILRLWNILPNDQRTFCGKFVFYFKSVAGSTIEYGAADYNKDEDAWGLSHFSYNNLIDPEKKYIVNGFLTLEMKGIFFVRDFAPSMDFWTSQGSLSSALWENDEHRDLSIVVGKEGEAKTEIKVHKLVLAIRSPVFNRMLQTNMKEKAEGKVDIVDFDADVVQEAVKFCYDQYIFGSKTCRNWRKLIDLYHFADKYDIADLRQKTEDNLVSIITFENLCQILNAAIETNFPKLQDFCTSFFLKCFKKSIPIEDIKYLDDNLSKELMIKGFSVENC